MESNDPPLVRFFKEKGITQDEIARQLGVSQSYVSALLTGKKAFGKKQAHRFSELYGLSPSWLLTGAGEMLRTGDVQVGGSNFGRIHSDDISLNPESVSITSADVRELISQNGKLIDIIMELTKKQ